MSTSDWSRKRGREGNDTSETKAEAGDAPPSSPPPPPPLEAQQQAAPAPPPSTGPPQPFHPPPVQHPAHPRYPPGARAPDGYYQPAYPPPGPEAAGAYPPPRGYEGAPYGIPPSHVPPGYPPPMYPYHAPMYSYPGYPPAPPHAYGYPPPDPNIGGPPGHPPHQPRYLGDDHGAGVGHYGTPPASAAVTHSSRDRAEGDDGKPHSGQGLPEESSEGVQGGEGVESDSAPIVPGAVTARLKTYIKPRIPSTQDVLDRRSRKNAQSRARAAKLRMRISDIEVKKDTEKTEEEKQLWDQYEARRRRKNDRSRERALEKKEEIDRILAKPEKKRTKIEKKFLDTAMNAKKRKNEGDRLRRQRLKDLGLSTKGTGLKPGISARGPLPMRYQPPAGHPGPHPQYPPHPHPGHPPHGYPSHLGEIPMSPMPSMGGHPHHPMHPSPGPYGSPGMMPNMGYPSPQQARRPPGPGQGSMDTPGRASQGAQLPFIPPAQSYEGHGSPAASRGQLQQTQQQQHEETAAASSSVVEQRRNPDGSMSISIGGGGSTGGSSLGGEARMPGAEEQASAVNISDVSHLLLYSDNGEEGGDREEGNAGEEKLEE